MIAATELADYVPIIIAVVGSGGIVGAIVAFLKVRPEAGQIAVTAAGDALVVQSGVITTLREENSQLRIRLENLESKVALMMDLRERVEELEDERKKLRAENGRLRKRVASLETQVRAMGAEPVNGEHT
jgi:predicted RNase H-like nuclease (RuvC/YqgF family)